MFTYDQMIKAIEGKTEFRVVKRDFGWVVDYNVALKDTFVGETPEQTLILKNLRGTCFNNDGEIISLALDKFHNLGECEGWREQDIDFTQPHSIQEKLDGSMIRVIPMPDFSWRFGTRAGVTDVAELAEDFFITMPEEKQEEYQELISRCLVSNLTPIFEFTSRKQRIVIDYEEPALTLLTIRSNKTGKYMTPAEIKELGFAQVDMVKNLLTEKSSLTEVASEVKNWIGTEGVVVTFDNGFRVKIKADDYVLKHRALDGLKFEKDVVKIILTGGMDDILPIVDEKMADRLVRFRESLLTNINRVQNELDVLFESVKHIEDRKEFALVVTKTTWAKFMFARRDGKPMALLDFCVGKCNSQGDLESIRNIVGKSFLEF